MAPVEPGKMRERVTFSRRATTDDSYGNAEGAWLDQFTRSARVQPLRGGEQVMADRLTGRQPFVITVRYDAETRTITTDWRAVDVGNAAMVYNVRSITPDEAKRYIDLLCESGAAV